MPRSNRIHFPGAIYHAFSRSVEGRDIFSTDSLRRSFLDDLRKVREKIPFRLFAYCLMGNHFHMLIAVEQIPLGDILHRVLGRFAMRFNFLNDRMGHVFQRSYECRLCSNDRYFLALIRYIHRNPIEVGFVRRVPDWPWSSYGAYMGTSTDDLVDTSLGLGLLHPDPIRARRILRRFIEGAGSGEPPAAPAADVPIWKPLGERGGSATPMPPLSDLANCTAEAAGILEAALRGPSRARPISQARRKFVLEALSNGHRPIEIATFLGRSDAWVAQLGPGLGIDR